MNPKPRIGIYSGYDPRPWVMEECFEHDLEVIRGLIKRIEALGKYEVVWPGRRKKGWSKVVHSSELARETAQALFEAEVDGVVNVHPTWTFPQLSQQVMSSYARLLQTADPSARPRLVMVSIQDTTVPGMVSGMATGGAFQQIGMSFDHVYGDFEDPALLAELEQVLDLFVAREVVEGLHRLHALEFGSFSLQMPTTRIDQEELTRRWGITSESLDQQVFLDRAFGMFDWAGEPGRSEIRAIRHAGVRAAVEGNYDAAPEKFAVLPDREVSRDKYALQVAMYFAVQEIADEKGAGAVTIKCQDECSGVYATCCQATSFLGNDTDPNGKRKRLIPTSCETDLPTMYSQYLLQELSGKPSGFGDFRFVKSFVDPDLAPRGEGAGAAGERTLLAIVNCGQHPLYYAGREQDSLKSKRAAVEYPGQEHFYAAGGAAVRMRTAGGQDLTVARLGVENGRLYLVACPMRSVEVPAERFEAYNRAWPIIEGEIPVSDQVMGRKWPSNHLGFVYGDHVPALIELAERMGLGYLIWDRDGREHTRAS